MKKYIIRKKQSLNESERATDRIFHAISDLIRMTDEFTDKTNKIYKLSDFILRSDNNMFIQDDADIAERLTDNTMMFLRKYDQTIDILENIKQDIENNKLRSGRRKNI